MCQLLQHFLNRDRRYKGAFNEQACVDLILVDMPEGLPVLGNSVPPTSIPPWNMDSKEWLQPIFDFTDQHLHDDGALIIIHPFYIGTKSNILGYRKNYGFEVRKEWWGMNRLHLASPTNPSATICSNLPIYFSSLFYFIIVLNYFLLLLNASMLADNAIWHLPGS